MSEFPRIFAHRGASSLAPENTIAAFAKAMEVGARWFEFDVDITGDGSLIVIHDDTLDRTRGPLVLGHVPLRAHSRGHRRARLRARSADGREPRDQALRGR